jgi:uncharacterized protein YkwD
MIAKLALCAPFVGILPLALQAETPRHPGLHGAVFALATPARRVEASHLSALCGAVLGARAPDMADSKAQAAVKLVSLEKSIVEHTNAERARYGLPPLQVDAELMESARRHAQWMGRNRILQHTRASVAENIAMGQPDSRSVLASWMSSSGHRANILNPGHRRIGVAAFQTLEGLIYWCQQFRP